MIKPDLIIFDCDGVLVDSEVLSCRCLSEALAGNGIQVGVDQVLDLFLGQSIAAVLDHYRESGLLNSEQFSAELAAKVRAAFRSGLGPVAGVRAVLERLRIPCCVASSSDFDRVTFSLSLTGLESHFGTRLYTSQMVERGKPDPEPYRRGAELIHSPAADCLVVEDAPSGVGAGIAAGCRVLGVLGTHTEDELRAAGASWIVRSLEDVSAQTGPKGLSLNLKTI